MFENKLKGIQLDFEKKIVDAVVKSKEEKFLATVKTYLSLLENIDFESLPSKYNVLKEHLLKDYGSLNVQASDVYNLAQK